VPTSIHHVRFTAQHLSPIRQAIHRVAKIAGVPKWRPYQCHDLPYFNIEATRLANDSELDLECQWQSLRSLPLHHGLPQSSISVYQLSNFDVQIKLAFRLKSAMMFRMAKDMLNEAAEYR